MLKAFENVRAYVHGKGIVKTDIAFDKKIRSFSAIENAEKIEIPQNCIVLPGFIDEHLHGAGGADIAKSDHASIKKIATTLAKSGTTAFLATPASETEEDTLGILSSVYDYIQAKEKDGAEVVGVHLEGPFLAHKFKGGMVEENLRLPSVETFEKYYEASGKTVKMVTLAPELDGADQLIKRLKELDIVASIGHSAATYNDVLAAKEQGASCVTHTYNAQSPLHHREVGVLGSALLFDELYCEIIADTVHVSVPAMQILVKNKPRDKVVLITDSLIAQGLPVGEYDSGGQTIVVDGTCCRLKNGTLAGTVVPINGMIKNLVEKVGVSFTDAVDFATINPARNLKIDDRKGSIDLEKDADFAVLDENFDVYMTVRGGEIVYLKA